MLRGGLRDEPRVEGVPTLVTVTPRRPGNFVSARAPREKEEGGGQRPPGTLVLEPAAARRLGAVSSRAWDHCPGLQPLPSPRP
jgi:hypothetical protein